MGRSQNGAFSGEVVEAEPDAHPTGEAVARAVAEGLRARGWEVGAIEVWRDSGWELTCTRAADRLRLYVTAGGGDAGFVQVAPATEPGLLGRLRGQRASAGDDAILALATDVHALLAAAGFTELRWTWDGHPDGAPYGPPRAAAH